MIEYLLKINDKYKKNKVNSAVIQAEFYARCKEENIICYLEYKERNSRFDALIFDRDLNKIAIVEFKSYASKEKKGIKNTKQIKKYLSYNLPVLLIVRHEEIEINITKLKLFLKKKFVDKISLHN
jgi:hypothetical protein